MNDTGMNCNEIVKALFNKMSEDGVSTKEAERRSGIGVNVIGRWRKRREPLLGNAIAALNSVGLELRVVPLEGFQKEQASLFDHNR